MSEESSRTARLAASTRKSLVWQQAGRRAAVEMGVRLHEIDRSPAGDFTWEIESHRGPITLAYSTTAAAYPATLRAQFVNRRKIQFELSPAGLDAPDVSKELRVGDPSLDGRHHLATGSPLEVTAILRRPTVGRLLSGLPADSLWIRTRDLPGKSDELFSPLAESFADVEILRTLLELFEELLRALVTAREEKGDVVLRHIRTLRRPRRVTSGRGKPSVTGRAAGRVHAAQQLGLLGDRRAFFALARSMDDPARAVRVVAARALGRLGDPRGIAVLLPFLGDDLDDVQTIARVARESLAQLGAGPLVHAFDEALNGDTEPLVALAGENRSLIIEALLRSLTNPRRRAFAYAYQALADLNAVEALPILEAKLAERHFGAIWLPAIRSDCEAAIERLKSLQVLPRLAAAPPDDVSTLPRQASPDVEDTSGLPRPSSGKWETKEGAS